MGVGEQLSMAGKHPKVLSKNLWTWLRCASSFQGGTGARAKFDGESWQSLQVGTRSWGGRDERLTQQKLQTWIKTLEGYSSLQSTAKALPHKEENNLARWACSTRPRISSWSRLKTGGPKKEPCPTREPRQPLQNQTSGLSVGTNWTFRDRFTA